MHIIPTSVHLYTSISLNAVLSPFLKYLALKLELAKTAVTDVDSILRRNLSSALSGRKEFINYINKKSIAGSSSIDN